MKPTVFIGFLFFAITYCCASNISEQDKVKLTETYKKAATLFGQHCLSYKPQEDVSELDFSRLQSPTEPQKYSIQGGLVVHVGQDTFNLHGVFNYQLAKKLSSSRTSQIVPRWPVEKVAVQAMDYLKQWNIDIPSGCELSVLKHDVRYRACWEVRWTRFFKSYPWDSFNETNLESVHVIFSEEIGLIGVGSNIYSPEPKNTEVILSRADAIEKAAKYVPLVMRTPFYRQAREAGFIGNGISECELKVAVPNWLLDPARAVWIREKPPEETRLCWVVRFTTIDGEAKNRGLKNKESKSLQLIPPEILIYIDASTGEVVGANFT